MIGSTEQRRTFEIVTILVIILGSLEFFKIYFLSEFILKQIQIGSLGLILMFIIIEYIYNREERFVPTFSIEIGLILLAVFASMFIAFNEHGQNFKTSLIAQRFMYFYAFYYMLHALRIKPDDLITIIVILGVLISILYIVQYSIHPFELFVVRVEEERGTLRIFFPGQSYIFMTYFFSLLKFFDKYKYYWLLITLLTFTIVILLGTRIIITTSILCTLIFLLTSKKVKSKLILIPLGILLIVPFYFLFQDIFTNLIELSQRQRVTFSENARVKAVQFFLSEFFPTKLSYILGNGADSLNSMYGQKVNQIREQLGYYQGDIGLIGDYTKFGLIFVGAVFSIYFRTLTAYYPYKYRFMFYYILFIAILFLFSGDFGNVSAYIPVLMVLYIIDINKHDKKYNEYQKIYSHNDNNTQSEITKDSINESNIGNLKI